jgi:hypothetical protein
MTARDAASLAWTRRLRDGIEGAVAVAGGIGLLAFFAVDFWVSTWAGGHRTPDPALGDTVLIHAGRRGHTIGYVTPAVDHIRDLSWSLLIFGGAAFAAAMIGLRKWKERLEDEQDALDEAAGTRPPDMRGAENPQ